MFVFLFYLRLLQRRLHERAFAAGFGDATAVYLVCSIELQCKELYETLSVC